MIAKRVLFAGTVQGVGFRYTTRGIAQGFSVAGFVRNLPDGQVELVAEGTAEEVERFLDAVSRRMAENIESQQGFDEPLHHFAGFEIRH
jgi:acylphosphatase